MLGARRITIALSIAIQCTAAVLQPVTEAVAQVPVQATERAPLELAIAAFRRGEFAFVVDRLGPELGRLSGTERVDAYLYFARSLVRLGRTEEAVAAFQTLIEFAPSTEPDPTRWADNEISAFKQAQLNVRIPVAVPEAHPRTTPLWRRRRALIGGASVGAAAVLAVLLARPHSGTDKWGVLPGPPDPPSNP